MWILRRFRRAGKQEISPLVREVSRNTFRKLPGIKRCFHRWKISPKSFKYFDEKRNDKFNVICSMLYRHGQCSRRIILRLAKKTSYICCVWQNTELFNCSRMSEQTRHEMMFSTGLEWLSKHRIIHENDRTWIPFSQPLIFYE